MLTDIPTLTQLIKTLQQIPYLASKNVYRVAHHFLVMDPQRLEEFCALLLHAKSKVKPCPSCFFWQEQDKGCSLCTSSKRDKSVICVTESWQELIAIEKTGGYDGLYHVLGGVICPLEGIGPEQLTIEPLVKRIQNAQGAVREIILATNQTPEGEVTAAFIARSVASMNVAVSCLARGIPVVSYLEYMDRLTVYKALSERRPF